MLRECLEPGPGDAGDRRMGVEIAGNLFRISRVFAHAQTQRLETAQDQHGVERRQGGAGHVLEPAQANVIHDLAAPAGDAGNEVAMASEIFRCGMHDDVRAQGGRLNQVGTGVGVVDHGQRTGAPRAVRDGGDIHDPHVRIGNGLEIDKARALAQGRIQRGDVGHVDMGDPDAELGEAMVQEGKSAAVERGIDQDLVTGFEQAPHDGGDRAHSGAECDRGLRVFE